MIVMVTYWVMLFATNLLVILLVPGPTTILPMKHSTASYFKILLCGRIMKFKLQHIMKWALVSSLAVSIFEHVKEVSLHCLNVSFLLSEHILCKESIVIVKKFDFDIFTYLYVFRSSEFICAIFTVMYVCM